jgi:hypothetical protein
MNSQISITLYLPAFGWQVTYAPVERFNRVAVNATKRHLYPAQGCLPMTD